MENKKTHQKDYNHPGYLAEELIKIMVDNAMREERNRYLQAESYERTPTRADYATGYKPKSGNTSVGKDAINEKARENEQIRDAAVLIATGIDPKGARTVLGISVSLSVQEEYRKTLLKDLRDRGMRGVKSVISDAHAGLGAARMAVLGCVGQCSMAEMSVPVAVECSGLHPETVHASRSSCRYLIYLQYSRQENSRDGSASSGSEIR